MGLFRKKKKSIQEIQKIINGFHKAIEKIKQEESHVHAMVGHGINMMNSMFLDRFNDINSFLKTPVKEKQKYIQSVCKFESELNEKDHNFAMGVLLYRIWIVEMNNYGYDSEHVTEMSKELAWLSKKGEILGDL